MTANDSPAVQGGPADETGDGLFTVQVIGLPVAVQARAEQQANELGRELTLIGEGLRQQGDHGQMPARLVALVEQRSDQYASFTVGQEQQIADAIAAGVDSVNLTYRVPASAADAAKALGDLLDEADEYCRQGRYLLTLATPPELVAYRRWFLAQFTGQAAGQAPLAWADRATGACDEGADLQ